MLPPLATIADLEARLGLDPGTLQGADLARARAALDDASSLVRMEARRTWTDELGVVTAPDVIIRVVLAAALRNYTNPDGVIQEAVGPFSRRYADGSTGMYLTKVELDIIRRYRPTGGDIWTLRTERDGCDAETIWYQDTFGFEPFPLASTHDVAWPT